MSQPIEPPSLEQSVKAQFAKLFTTDDWWFFKQVAEVNLAEAVLLRKSSFSTIDERLQLLLRNSRKRLLLGIGIELLVKAIYLKSGYGINKPRHRKTGPNLPFKLADIDNSELDAGDTYTLAQLIDQLPKICEFPDQAVVLKGLKIAKVFRNKEGHVVTQRHQFDPSNYRAVELTLRELYMHAFGETLTIRFAFAVGEKGTWRISP